MKVEYVRFTQIELLSGSYFASGSKWNNIAFDGINLPNNELLVDEFIHTHDLLDHCNGFNKIGTVTDELEALGSAMYYRYSDQEKILGMYTYGKSEMLNDINGIGMLYLSEDSPFFEKHKHYLKKEMDLTGDFGTIFDSVLITMEISFKLSRERAEEYKIIAYHLMKKGYDAMEKKMKTESKAVSMFSDIFSELESAFSNKNKNAVALEVDFENGSVVCS